MTPCDKLGINIYSELYNEEMCLATTVSSLFFWAYESLFKCSESHINPVNKVKDDVKGLVFELNLPVPNYQFLQAGIISLPTQDGSGWRVI